MIKYIILLVFCLVLAAPVYWVPVAQPEEDWSLTEAYEEVYEQSRRIRERQQDYIIQKNEIERNQREFERNYHRNDSEWEYHYDYETDRSTWEKDGMIIGDE